MQYEILKCGVCTQKFAIPVEDFADSEDMCCPYCRETKKIFDIETVEFKEAV